MQEYKLTLQNVVSKKFPKELEGDEWLPLNDLITSEVLKDAYESGKKISVPGLKLIPRNLKTMERINVKKKMVRPDSGFKTNCDLMAFRVLTKNIKEIDSIVNKIVEHNKSINNPVHIREQIYGPDIVQYMYVFHREVGFLAEYQIGHPFAVLKFKHDSAIRDGIPGINFKKGKIRVYDLIKERLLKGEDIELETTWQEAFGEVPSDEWKQCF